jgi:hypothetical protein
LPPLSCPYEYRLIKPNESNKNNRFIFYLYFEGKIRIRLWGNFGDNDIGYSSS